MTTYNRLNLVECLITDLLFTFFPLTSSVKLISYSEVNAGFFYKTAERREKFAIAERKFIDDRVEKIIAFKKQVCGGQLFPLIFALSHRHR